MGATEKRKGGEMRLTVEDLMSIATALTKLRETRLQVTQLRVGQHFLTLEWVSDPRDRDDLVLTNIDLAEKSHSKGDGQ